MTKTQYNSSWLLPIVLFVIVGFVAWHFSSSDVPQGNAVTGDAVALDMTDDVPIRIDLMSTTDTVIDTAIYSPTSGPEDESPPPSIPSPADSEAMIVVKTTGLPSNQGELRVAVFDSRTGFPNHADAMYTIEFPIPEKNGEFELEAMPPGDYAVAVYHDKNSDDTMNKGAFGIPTERYGFSNNARGTFGPPDFSAAVRTFESGRQVVDIELK